MFLLSFFPRPAWNWVKWAEWIKNVNIRSAWQRRLEMKSERVQPESRGSVCVDRSGNEYRGITPHVLDSLFSFVYAALYRWYSVSRSRRTRIFSAILTQPSSGRMKVMVRRNHFVVTSSIFSVLLNAASSDISPLSANILHWSPAPFVNLVTVVTLAEFAITLFITFYSPTLITTFYRALVLVLAVAFPTQGCLWWLHPFQV